MNNIETLKSLTQITFDSVEGYREAAKKAESPNLTRALEQRHEKRAQTLTTLNNQLIQFGTEPVTQTSAKGKAHQIFLSIADVFEDGDDAAAERVEEGEEYIAEQFRDALESDDLTPDMKPTVQSVYSEIKNGERFSQMIGKQYA